jgi:hypothetical protein
MTDDELIQICADAISNGLLPPVRQFKLSDVTSPDYDYVWMCHPDVPAPAEGELLYVPDAAIEDRCIVKVAQVDRPTLGDYIVRAKIVWP